MEADEPYKNPALLSSGMHGGEVVALARNSGNPNSFSSVFRPNVNTPLRAEETSYIPSTILLPEGVIRLTRQASIHLLPYNLMIAAATSTNYDELRIMTSSYMCKSGHAR